MKIEHQDIRLALLGFLELLENAEDQQPKIETLELWLGQLAFLQHFIGDIPDDNASLTLPTRDDAHWRKLIGENFPGFGSSVDDLAEIAVEISECVQRWEHAGENSALWYFKVGYQAHWGIHLRNLQTYLHNLP
jgi:hypothetical protein